MNSLEKIGLSNLRTHLLEIQKVCAEEKDSKREAQYTIMPINREIKAALEVLTAVQENSK